MKPVMGVMEAIRTEMWHPLVGGRGQGMLSLGILRRILLYQHFDFSLSRLILGSGFQYMQENTFVVLSQMIAFVQIIIQVPNGQFVTKKSTVLCS